MWEPFLGRGTLIVLFGTLALGNLTACTNTEAANVPNKTASSAPNSSATSAAQPSVEPPPSVEQPQPSEASDTYQQAIDIATGAKIGRAGPQERRARGLHPAPPRPPSALPCCTTISGTAAVGGATPTF